MLIKYYLPVIYRCRHRNLVDLLGFCSQPPSLVYEFMEEGNLYDRLHKVKIVCEQVHMYMCFRYMYICDSICKNLEQSCKPKVSWNSQENLQCSSRCGVNSNLQNISISLSSSCLNISISLY